MNVILSKKGFDTSYGQQSSIILPPKYGFKMISFPIPETNSKRVGIASEDLDYFFDNENTPFNLKDLFTQLEIENKIKDNKSKIFTANKYHFDPEIFKTSKTRKDKDGKYYATLGQSGPAAGTLKQIKEGDIFLFFGTFQRTILIDDDILKYDTYMEPIHAIWGYMFVDDIVHISSEDTCIKNEYLEKYPDLEKHLHFINRQEEGDKNVIFCGKRFGTFKYSDKCNDVHRLTKLGYQKTMWELPDFLEGAEMGSLRDSKDGKIINPQRVLIHGIGQELIIKESTFNEAGMIKWLEELGVKF